MIPDPTTGMQRPDAGGTDESCLLWTVATVQGNRISTAEMQIPGKARGQYRKACSDLNGKKLANAENHLRTAVQEYPKYAAAWVLLGQVLEAGKRTEDARAACVQASAVNPDYAPAYLCLADTSAQQQDWNQTLVLANRALALDPAQGLYGYFYNAIAQFHLNHLPDAEKGALETIDADRLHRLPQVHLLLAQIFGAKNDPCDEAAQLRAYLKIVPNSPDSAAVRKSLAELEAKTVK